MAPGKLSEAARAHTPGTYPGDMEYLIVLAVTLLLGAVVLVWSFIHWRKTRRTTRDDLLRVGDDTELSPYEASRRAEGKAAWTRISGGGV